MSLIIQIISDNCQSWIIDYSKQLESKLNEQGHKCNLIHSDDEIRENDVLFILGCEKIISNERLNLSKFPLVVHESDLPRGRGWAPLSWQVLEGKNEIPVTLIRAEESVDSGAIYLKRTIKLHGTELCDELRHLQGLATIELALEFVENYKNIRPRPQVGEPSFYKKRTPENSELNIDSSIREQFNLLRICDNKRYPAFFEINGMKYKLEISKYE